MIRTLQRQAMLITFAAAWAGSLASTAQAQCPDPEWLNGEWNQWVDSVLTLKPFDPDGAGPAPAIIIAAGSFSTLGGPSKSIVGWDPQARDWVRFDEGLGSAVYSVEPAADGTFIAGGTFISASGLPVNRIAQWNMATQSWGDVGGGVTSPSNDAYIYALATLPNGDVIAGGKFGKAGAKALNNIARWDGSVWHALGAGVIEPVKALLPLPNGDLIVGGFFESAGGKPANRIARWNGASWSTLGTGLTGGVGVNTIISLPSGDLLVGGDFTNAGGPAAQSLARWDGSQWHAVPADWASPANTVIESLFAKPDGHVLISGRFALKPAQPNTGNILSWDGVTFTGVGDGIGGATGVQAVFADTDGDVYVGGKSMGYAGGADVCGIARLDGSRWAAVSPNMDARIRQFDVSANGDLLAVGVFQCASAQRVDRLARWNGEHWSPIADLGLNGEGQSIRELANGDLIVGGTFTKAGDVDAKCIARWDGAGWHALGAGLSHAPQEILPREGDEIVVGGPFFQAGGLPANYIARWDGSSWHTMGSGIGQSPMNNVRALVTMPNNDIVAGGRFLTAGGTTVNHIARWDGSTWSKLGSGVSEGGTVWDLQVAMNGDLIAGGLFVVAGGTQAWNMARWDGAAWHAYGEGLTGSEVRTIAMLDGGELIVGGMFTKTGLGEDAQRLARWNGHVWSGIGSVEGGQTATFVNHLRVLADGSVVVGGDFFAINKQDAFYFARYGCSSVACYADCDATGELNIEDFICFQTVYALGDPSADCDGDTALTIDDFVCFQTLFAVGC